MSDTVKPCPFCGTPPRVFANDGLYSIVCDNKATCRVEAALDHFGDLDKTVEVWNRRAPIASEEATFPDASYDIPLEHRLRAATIDFSHPRLGIRSLGKHTIPLTTVEGKLLLDLFLKSVASEEGEPTIAIAADAVVSSVARAWRCACGELITHGVTGHEDCASSAEEGEPRRNAWSMIRRAMDTAARIGRESQRFEEESAYLDDAARKLDDALRASSALSDSPKGTVLDMEGKTLGVWCESCGDVREAVVTNGDLICPDKHIVCTFHSKPADSPKAPNVVPDSVSGTPRGTA